MDILPAIKIANVPVEKAVFQVLSQAFCMTLIDVELKHHSARLEKLLKFQ